MVGKHGSRNWVPRALISNVSTKTKESKLGGRQSLKFPKPAPGDTLPLAPPKRPQIAPPTMDQKLSVQKPNTAEAHFQTSIGLTLCTFNR